MEMGKEKIRRPSEKGALYLTRRNEIIQTIKHFSLQQNRDATNRTAEKRASTNFVR